MKNADLTSCSFNSPSSLPHASSLLGAYIDGCTLLEFQLWAVSRNAGFVQSCLLRVESFTLRTVLPRANYWFLSFSFFTTTLANMVWRHSSYLYRTVLCLPLFWKAILAFPEEVCEWPVGIEKCSDCASTNLADLTSGLGYGFGPDGLPCFGGTVPSWDQGPGSNGNPGSPRPPPIPTASTSGGPYGPSGTAGPRVFYLTATWETRAPDGNARDMFLINDQFPGPKLEINQGEDVEIYYQNDSPFNTTIHFHGKFLPLPSYAVVAVQADYFFQA